MKKIFIKTIMCSAAAMLITSCTRNPDSPGVEYMPDMYRSTSYESNSMNMNFADSMTNRMPVSGTISQGAVANSAYGVNNEPYAYKNDNEGYELAGQNLKSPFAATPEMVDEGKIIYGKYCQHCHGESGAGDGKMVQNEKFPPPPSYSGPLKNLPEGKMFHTLQYGKGLMGSHASQLSKEERWKVIGYVQTLQGSRETAPGDIVKGALK